MKVRFQADADFNRIIIKAALRREPTIDFQTAEAANLVGLDDPEVLGDCRQGGQSAIDSRSEDDAKTLCGLHHERNKLWSDNRSTANSR
jgi:hypothetical protein